MHRLRLTLTACSLSMALAGQAQAARAQPMGETLFAENCAACHQKTGLGVKGAFPALAGDGLVKGPAAPLTATILNGRGGMPAFKGDLDDARLAEVITYIRMAWGNRARPVTSAEVAAVRTARGAVAVEQGLQAH